MKNFINILVVCALLAGISACEKNDISNEDIQRKKIEDIIPQQYIDSLKKMGLNINTGTKPPNVEGTYSLKPFILDTSNFKDSYLPGYRFSDGLVKLFNQSTTDYSIELLGKNYIKERDTSIATAISGDGNQFTVYGKVKASNEYNNSYVIFAILISGSMENGNIKNYKTGIICIDDTENDGTFITKGHGRIAYDSDKTSDKVSDDVIAKNGVTPPGFSSAKRKAFSEK